VLAANSLALALAPYYAVGTNLVRATFLDPRVRDMYDDWELITESAVAALRSLVGPDVDDPRLNELVGELSVRSDPFRRLWAATTPVRGGVARHGSPIPRSARWSSATRSSRSPTPTARRWRSTTRRPAAPARRRSRCWRR